MMLTGKVEVAGGGVHVTAYPEIVIATCAMHMLLLEYSVKPPSNQELELPYAIDTSRLTIPCYSL